MNGVLSCPSTYNESRLAPIPARCRIQVVPTLVLCCIDPVMAQYGCLAKMNVMLIPHAAIQAVTVRRKTDVANHRTAVLHLSLRSVYVSVLMMAVTPCRAR